MDLARHSLPECGGGGVCSPSSPSALRTSRRTVMLLWSPGAGGASLATAPGNERKTELRWFHTWMGGGGHQTAPEQQRKGGTPLVSCDIVQLPLDRLTAALPQHPRRVQDAAETPLPTADAVPSILMQARSGYHCRCCSQHPDAGSLWVPLGRPFNCCVRGKARHWGVRFLLLVVKPGCRVKYVPIGQIVKLCLELTHKYHRTLVYRPPGYAGNWCATILDALAPLVLKFANFSLVDDLNIQLEAPLNNLALKEDLRVLILSPA
ncbi:hypothetical protein NDU88_000601 [Pleurodeles waltl]|uniref:Uncharacterized protein n=1 Tax=Pleurodeles waltl TaxID=8319 RepID=A0AAV7Q3L8_PLEWA|nr:hypothetical protein NDU88_000601 [Pleurodeles waltl]